MTVDQILKQYGTPTNASKQLGFTLQTLRNWKEFGIPLRSQFTIQSMTNGKLKADKNGKRA